jgi:hypothetical protein
VWACGMPTLLCVWVGLPAAILILLEVLWAHSCSLSGRCRAKQLPFTSSGLGPLSLCPTSQMTSPTLAGLLPEASSCTSCWEPLWTQPATHMGIFALAKHSLGPVASSTFHASAMGLSLLLPPVYVAVGLQPLSSVLESRQDLT